MRWNIHPGRALVTAILAVLMLPVLAGAQGTPSTPVASPQAPEQAVWERLAGVEQAVMRTWGDVPAGTPAPGQAPTLRFVTGLVAQFDGPTNAAVGVEPIRDWMLASLQVNLVDVELTIQEVEVADLGDSASAVTASGTAGDLPLSIAVLVVQQEDRVLASGGSVMAEQDLLPTAQGIVTVMLERQPGGEEQRDNVGRFSGGLWDIFPEAEDAALDGMRRQGDLPIYQAQPGG
jgi:hypothetical protein